LENEKEWDGRTIIVRKDRTITLAKLDMWVRTCHTEEIHRYTRGFTMQYLYRRRKLNLFLNVPEEIEERKRGNGGSARRKGGTLCL